jgi:hypothetical protein
MRASARRTESKTDLLYKNQVPPLRGTEVDCEKRHSRTHGRRRSHPAQARPVSDRDTEPRRTVELWPCGYVAKCSAPECRRRATTILRYLDNQEAARPSDRRLRQPRERALRCAESDRPQAIKPGREIRAVQGYRKADSAGSISSWSQTERICDGNTSSPSASFFIIAFEGIDLRIYDHRQQPECQPYGAASVTLQSAPTKDRSRHRA